MVKEEKRESLVLTTRIVKEIEKKENLGLKLKLHEKLWFQKTKGVRKAGITFAMTDGEIKEYAKCKMSVHYFAQKYCQIKREDGTIGPMTLRDYQKDIIDLYTNNRFSILMASRQTGKCNSFSIKVLCKNINGETEEITLGELYYRYLKEEKDLTLLEICKYYLYKFYNFLS